MGKMMVKPRISGKFMKILRLLKLLMGFLEEFK